ncbi:SHOCT domain-containing protein [Dehalococcoidia bacterium]|nr:SHOCT domain-containing protein [Dehalococcoidia bacterium]MCL0096941.1 SHOCT domain-containing protein [Dehalococcoidia bacterium]
MDKNLKLALVIGGIVLAVLIVLPLVFGLTGGWHGGGWGMPWPLGVPRPCGIGGFGGGWFMPVFMILFWGLVIWGVVALVRGTSQPSGPASDSSRPDSAMQVLKKRYAAGKISKAEYEEKRNDIS